MLSYREPSIDKCKEEGDRFERLSFREPDYDMHNKDTQYLMRMKK